ncbi:MAG TPA: V-type ATPase 116kDa subunit family protein [Anaeromyxobacteraceae bacterium]|nr:V-type ATPase 116kDa subunit family protein [Anaeromyxobacteraceae bacterium]
MIAPMSKVQVLGPRRLLEPVLAFLQRQGVLDLRTPSPLAAGAPSGSLRSVPLREGEHAVEVALESALESARALLAALPATGRAEEEALPTPGDPEFAARLADLSTQRHALEDRIAALKEESQVVDRYGRLLVALAPLRPSLPKPGDPQALGLVMRHDPNALSLLDAELQRLTEGNCSVQARPAGEDQLAVLVTVPRPRAKEVAALLFERGVEEIRLPARYAGQPLVDALRLLIARERDLPAQIAAAEEDLVRFAGRVAPAMRRAIREARERLERLRALATCGETRHAFVVTGFLPRARVPSLDGELARAFEGRVTIVAHAPVAGEEEDVPVVLVNPPALRPFERLLALVPPPTYGSIDPTPYLAVCFPMLFGLILGDAGFGVLGLALALVWRWRGWGGAAGRDLAAIALACSVAAVVFGVLFGEAFGDLGARLGMRPVLMDRRRAVLSFLALAVGVGVVHVGLGTALGAAHSFRRGHVREGLERAGRLVLLCGGAAAGSALAGLLPRGALWPSLFAAAAGVLLAVAGGGPLALLDVVLSLGNVLSYARLMALGLASVLLAEVANRMATAVHPAAVGITLALLLHAVNFTLGLVSPLIASLRLHYVEFFEKFYEGGGRPYRPFALES